MLIQVGGLPRSQSTCSQFWSWDTLCMVSHGHANTWGHIRLWRGHPWLQKQIELTFIAREYVSRYTKPRNLMEDSIGLAVSDTWVFVCCTAAVVQLPRGAATRPDRYWFKKKGKKLGTDYALSVKYTESLCCYLCRVMRSTP